MILPQFLKTLERNYQLVKGHSRIGIGLTWLDKQGATVGKVFDKYAQKHPEKICFLYENERWTFKQVEETSNRIGNYFDKEGFRHKDVISLLMENRPEYVCTWLGLSKLGVITSLINYNLRHQPLRHCLDVAKTKALICGTELANATAELGDLPYPTYLYGKTTDESEHWGRTKGWKHLDNELTNVSTKTAVPKDPKSLNFRSSLLYCFTSGTTGFPKAAVITHSRFFTGSYVNHYASEFNEDDRIYMTLPLYHVAGGLLALSQTFVWGNSLIIRKKFSASTFWKDCYEYKATAAQYIAETCRFLLQSPQTEWEKKHSVTIMFGNGFRRDIWPAFVERFNIQKVTEFYASTEGNANLVNYDNTVGAVGYIPPFLQKIYPITLVRIDEDTGELIRDPTTGHLTRCKPGEVGELLGKIVQNSPLREFKGYAADKAANEKKMVRNVFKDGDTYFRTGDLLYKDETGYHYFSDRMGETFRWKSENVSTAEVEVVVSQACDLRDVIAFGVKVPHYDGSAGMAVIADPANNLDFSKMQSEIIKNLPHYARPLFIRITKQIPMTGTHKLQKVELSKQANDLSKCGGDKMYILLNEKYVPYTKDHEKRLLANEIRL